MNIELKPGERLDDLQRNGYKIIQDPGRFCFGMDAVLLSGFAKVKQGERVVDLGTVRDHTDSAGSKKQGRILYWIGDPARRVRIWHHAVSSSMIFRNGFTL